MSREGGTRTGMGLIQAERYAANMRTKYDGKRTMGLRLKLKSVDDHMIT